MMTNLFTLLALASMSSFAEAKTTTYSKGGYTLVVNDKTDKFSAATQQKFVDVFFNVYPKEVAEYNPKAPKKVNFVIDPEYHGVAAANGDTVRFDPSYFASHPKDIDVVTHECMHLVQAYRWGNVPRWAVEGIADYVRYAMGVDNQGAGWSLPAFDKSQKYTDAYRVTARFFLWIEKKVKAGFVKGYDSALRDGRHDGFFQRATGKSMDQLWAEYAKNPAV